MEEKPILRRLSAMTPAEQKEWVELTMERSRIGGNLFLMGILGAKTDAWCREHGLDNKGLIDKGLAIEKKD